MGKMNLEHMDDVVFDVLKELGNIGTGNAVTALSKMLGQKVDMKLPKVQLLTFAELTECIGNPDDETVGVLLLVEGDITGMMMYVASIDSARYIVKLLTGIENNDVRFSDMELSVLHEIGNIMAGAYLSALSDLTHLKIIPSVPHVQIDMAAAILSVPAIEFGKISDKVLLIETSFSDDINTDGYFILMPDVDSYDKIFGTLGM